MSQQKLKAMFLLILRFIHPKKKRFCAECAPNCAEECMGVERTGEPINTLPCDIFGGGGTKIALANFRVCILALNHAVAESEKIWYFYWLVSGVNDPSLFLLPTRQTDYFWWCLNKGMRVKTSDADGDGRVLKNLIRLLSTDP